MYYAYEAAGKNGQVLKGSAKAASVPQLKKDLAVKGQVLISARPDLLAVIGKAMRAPKLSRGALIDLFGYLSGLMAMGMDMATTWKVVEESTTDKASVEAVVLIKQSIEQGFTLSASMVRTGAFPDLVIGSVKAGEASGTLEAVFAALEKHYREEAELASQVMKATMYPLISVVILFMIGVGLLTYVIPQLKEIFPPDPPWPTALMVMASNGAVGYWWTIPLATVSFGFIWWRTPERVKGRIWETLYKAWVIGPLLKNLALVNLFFNFSMMLASGVSILQAIDTIIEMTEARAIKIRLKTVQSIISSGGMFSDGFQDPFFPKVVGSALKQGETTGNLDLYMLRVANFLRDRTRARLQTLATFIEPLLLLMGGAMILFLAVGIFLPIYGQMKQMR